MAGRRRIFGALLVTFGVMLAMLGLPTAVTAEEIPQECDGAFRGDAPGSLEITSTATSPVPAGSTIPIEATWDTTDWAAASPDGDLDKIIACMRIGGEVVDAVIEKPTKNTGTWSTDDLAIPAGTPDGSEVCIAARLSGQPAQGNPSTSKTDLLCFTVGTPDQPPPPPPPTYELTVSKSVVGTPAQGEAFDFTVDCEPFDLAASNTDGSGVTVTDGVASFRLGNGESEKFTGIPGNATCTVTETIVGGGTWTTTINGTADDDRVIDVDIDDANRTAAYENTKVVPPVQPTQQQTPNVAPQQEQAPVVAGVQVSRETPAPAVAAAAAPRTQALAATGMSPVLLGLGLTLVGLGAMLTVGARKTVRPVGRHYLS